MVLSLIFCLFFVLSALNNFGIFNAEGFDCNVLHSLVFDRSVCTACLAVGNCVYYVHAFDNLSESGIFAVKMR